MPGTLFVVSTPIGNLEDITLRAIRVLSEVELIACEDTRHTRKLLNHYDIKTRTISYHEHNERERSPALIGSLQTGMNIALVSDAGTPGISDPGYTLINQAVRAGLRVVSVPGPTALISALVASGLPADEFLFVGFLPSRSQARRRKLEELAQISATLVFYEAPHRIKSTLKDMSEILGNRQAAVGRELTKLHEELLRGTLSELATQFNSGSRPRGEMVLIVDQNVIASKQPESTGDLAALVAALEKEGLDSRSAWKQAAKKLGIKRSDAYREMMELRRKKG